MSNQNQQENTRKQNNQPTFATTLTNRSKRFTFQFETPLQRAAFGEYSALQGRSIGAQLRWMITQELINNQNNDQNNVDEEQQENLTTSIDEETLVEDRVITTNFDVTEQKQSNQDQQPQSQPMNDEDIAFVAALKAKHNLT